MAVATKIKFPYRYDEVGSLLRPSRLKQARADYEAKKISVDDLRQVENEEISRIVKSRLIWFKGRDRWRVPAQLVAFGFFAGLEGVKYLFRNTDLFSMVKKPVPAV